MRAGNLSINQAYQPKGGKRIAPLLSFWRVQALTSYSTPPVNFTDKAFLVCVVPRLRETPKEKLQDAQAISEAVLDAEVRIGQLMRDVPKATTNHKNKDLENDSAVDFLRPKLEVIRESGFTQKQAERFQQLAAHPEIVEAAKAEARDNDDIATASPFGVFRQKNSL